MRCSPWLPRHRRCARYYNGPVMGAYLHFVRNSTVFQSLKPVRFACLKFKSVGRDNHVWQLHASSAVLGLGVIEPLGSRKPDYGAARPPALRPAPAPIGIDLDALAAAG